MSEHERLIRDLAAGLQPVRRLRAPWLRATIWAGLCALGTALLIWRFGAAPSDRDGAALPELLAFLFAVLTANCAAVAALSLAIPGRSWRWAWLPLPPLLLWIGTSGWDCWLMTDTGADLADAPSPTACFRFIVFVSLPLAAGLFVLLRRAYCVHERRTATLAGLASATAAAAMLEAYHAHAMSLTDMAAHASAVLLVVLISRLVLPRALA